MVQQIKYLILNLVEQRQNFIWTCITTVLIVNCSNISLNGTVYDFSVNHNSVEKEEILNIDEYLMVKNNIT